MNRIEQKILRRNPEDREQIARRLNLFLSLTKLDILDGKKIEEVFESQESIKKFLESLSTENYKALLVGVNAMVRNMDSRDEWKMDGEGVRMGNIDMFPEQTEKEKLLDESLAIAQSMLANGRSMEDVVILLTCSLTSIHPFGDGNGRTAKFILTLLLKGYDPQYIHEALTNDAVSLLVSGLHLQDVALNVIEKRFIPSDKYPTFDEHFFHSKEYNAQSVRLIMDMINNDKDERYKGWLTENTEESALETYKREIRQCTGKAFYEKLIQ